MKDLFRLLKYVKPYAGRFFLAVLLTVMVGVFETSFRVLLKPTLDRLMPSTASSAITPKASTTAQSTDEILQAQSSKLDWINDWLPKGDKGWYLLVALFPLLAICKGVSDFFADYF